VEAIYDSRSEVTFRNKSRNAKDITQPNNKPPHCQIPLNGLGPVWCDFVDYNHDRQVSVELHLLWQGQQRLLTLGQVCHIPGAGQLKSNIFCCLKLAKFDQAFSRHAECLGQQFSGLAVSLC